VKTVPIGCLRVSRFIVGGNPFSGFSHQSPEMSRRMERYYTGARIKETLREAESLGVNTIIARADRHMIRLPMEYWDEGGRLQWIAQTCPELGTPERSMRSADAVCVGVYTEGRPRMLAQDVRLRQHCLRGQHQHSPWRPVGAQQRRGTISSGRHRSMNGTRWHAAACVAGALLALSASGCAHVRNGIHNALGDAMDILRLDVSASWGTDMGAHVMATERLQLKSYSYENLYRVGLGTRVIGMWREEREDWWVGSWHAKGARIAGDSVQGLTAALPEKMRSGPDAAFARFGESPDEIGLGLHAFVIGLRIGLRPMELLDFLADFVGLDLCDDNLRWEERKALREAERRAPRRGARKRR